jgi:hypothetical protein
MIDPGLIPHENVSTPIIKMMSTQDIIYQAGGIPGLIIYFRHLCSPDLIPHLDQMAYV